MTSSELINSVGAPESLDLHFFEEVLENALYDPELAIQKVVIESGSAVGDNFCSQIYRVRLAYRKWQDDNGKINELSVIVKSIPIESDGMKFLLDLKVFLKEKIFYVHMLPRLEILLDNVKLGGRLYLSAREPINTLVFEDLRASGYVMADRQKGLDLEHCLLVMKKLGYLHGSSMILHKKEPTCMKSFKSGLLSEDSETFVVLFRQCFDALIKYVSGRKGLEAIAPKLQKYALNFKQNLINTQLPIPGELKVLNHGDLWVNNFLVKYKNMESRQSVEDVIFLDFQMSVFGSPGFDLNYFLYTSVQFEVLREKREELLGMYYRTLCDTLETYHFEKIPSFADILLEVRRRESFGFFAHYGIFPGVSMDKNESNDNTLEKFLEKDFADKKFDIMYSSKRVRDTMEYTLRRFDELGVLDV